MRSKDKNCNQLAIKDVRNIENLKMWNVIQNVKEVWFRCKKENKIKGRIL